MNYKTVDIQKHIEAGKPFSPQHLYDKEEGVIIHLYLQSSAVMPLHKTPVNVAFYLLEGSVEFQIGEEKVSLGQGSLLESPKDIQHGMRNLSSTSPARVLVMKLPRP